MGAGHRRDRRRAEAHPRRARAGRDRALYRQPVRLRVRAPHLLGQLDEAVGSRNSYGAGSQDNLADFLAAHFLYGASFRQPVPDVARTGSCSSSARTRSCRRARSCTWSTRRRGWRRRRARRQGRRARPAPDRDGAHRLRAPLHPPGHRRVPPPRDDPDDPRRGARGPRLPARATRATWRGCATLVAPFTPERRGGADGHRRRHHPPPRPRVRDAPTARAPSGAPSAAVRHAPGVGARRAERRHRQPRSAGRRRLLRRPGRPGRDRAAARPRRLRRAPEPHRRLPGLLGELPAGILADEITTPGAGRSARWS